MMIREPDHHGSYLTVDGEGGPLTVREDVRSGDAWGSVVLLRSAGEVAEHPAEDDAVERGDRPPVEVPEQAARDEGGPLSQPGARRVPVRVAHSARSIAPDGLLVFHVELEPGEPGQPHLGPQPQQPALLERLDPPEVQGLADVEIPR